MTVKELKQLLEGVDDNIDVLIPTSEEFNGIFFSPCLVESGISKMGIVDSIEELSEPIDEVLSSLIGEEKDEFILVPCGFFDEKDHSHELN